MPTPPTHANTRTVTLRGLEEPGVVIIEVKFPSEETAREGRDRLISSGVLDQFSGVVGPTLVEQADAAAA